MLVDNSDGSAACKQRPWQCWQSLRHVLFAHWKLQHSYMSAHKQKYLRHIDKMTHMHTDRELLESTDIYFIESPCK